MAKTGYTAMDDYRQAVSTHYTTAIDDTGALLRQIAALLDRRANTPLTALSLAYFDQFHVRGMVATVELARLPDIHSTMRVLDVGSGLGGPSRYLAETYGCTVSGVDITAAYVDIAKQTAARSAVGEKVDYQLASAESLPFADASFDLVWTQVSLMNVVDRHAAYREISRVLKPDGRLLVYDIIAGDTQQPLIYPVPWADTKALNHLLTKQETLRLLELAGFRPASWSDHTDMAANWFGQTIMPAAEPLKLTLVMGERYLDMLANLSRNFIEGRAGVAMARFERFRS